MTAHRAGGPARSADVWPARRTAWLRRADEGLLAFRDGHHEQVAARKSVTYTAYFTRVGVAARNQTGAAVSLPLYGYCLLTGCDGTTLQADPFRSCWSDTLAPASVSSELSLR